MNTNGSSPTHRPASFLQGVAIPTRDDKDPAADVKFMPPNFGRFPVSHFSTFQGQWSSAAKVYRDYDEAAKASLDNARYMRNDCGVMECIEARQRAVCLLGWHIEPEDEKSADQRELCEKLTQILQRIRRFTEYRYNLMHAIWYGKYAIQHRYGWQMVNGTMRQLPTPQHRDDNGWLPVNGDKLVFRHDAVSGAMPEGGYFGQMGIRVGINYTAGDLINNHWKVEATDRGMAYFLSPWQRNLIAVHKHMIEDAAYEDGSNAGSIHGVGIRSRIYWEWVQKQESLAFLMEYLERSAGGIELWKYPAGNTKAKAEVEEAAKKRVGAGHNLMLVPMPAGEDGYQYGVEVIEPGMAGIETLRSILSDYFGHRIKRYVLGQVLSSEAEATGLGSGVAELHLDTLMQIIRYDAQNLEETITFELLRPLMQFNFPRATNLNLQFRIDTESPDVEKKLQAWARAYEMGCRLKERDVMDMIGAAMPGPDDRVLERPEPTQEGGAAGGFPGQSPPINPAADQLHSAVSAAVSRGADGKIPKSEGGAGERYGADDGDEFDHGQRVPVGRYGCAESIAEAAAQTDTSPTDAQRQSGNYRKGKFRWNGLTIAIENPRGSTRSGVGSDGTPWSVTMQAHYGYILRHTSEADGDHVDLFMGPHPDSDVLFVVDQQTPGGRFDEHKVMAGYISERQAKDAYFANYSTGWKGFRSITAMTVGQFLEWLENGDTRRPIEGQVARYGKEFHENRHPRNDDGTFAPLNTPTQKPDSARITVAPSGADVGGRSEALKAGKSLRGTYKNNHTGWDIQLFADGIKDSIYRHSLDFRAIPALPDLLRGAVYFSSEEADDPKEEVKRVHFLYSPLKIEGDDLLARMVVKERHDGVQQLIEARLYNLSAHKTEKLASKTADDKSAKDRSVSEAGEHYVSIGQLIAAVKEKWPEHLSKDEKDRYARPRKPAKGQQELQWITIGGSDAGDDGKHVGGTPVLVDGQGRIHGGPDALTGKTLGELDKDKAGTEEDGRKENELPSNRSTESATPRAPDVRSKLLDELRTGRHMSLRELQNAAGHGRHDPNDPAGHPVNAALMALRDSGEISVHEPRRGEPSFWMTDEQIEKTQDAQGTESQVAVGDEVKSQSIGGEVDAGQLVEMDNGTAILSTADGEKAVDASTLEQADGTDSDKSLTSERLEALNHAMGGAAQKSSRFASGGSLTESERESVLKTVIDVYRDAGVSKDDLKGYHRDSGDPIYGYPYRLDLFQTSDITGRKLRHYITLPDGRKAHPSELYPQITQAMIDQELSRRESDEKRKTQRLKDKDQRIASGRSQANYLFNSTGRRLDNSYFAENASGQIVRVDGSDPGDVSHFESLGFSPVGQAQTKDRFAREFSAAVARYSESGSPGWRKVGGSSVYVSASGKITKGCPGLKGEKIDDIIDESEESRDRRDARQKHAEARGLQGHELETSDLRHLEGKRLQSQHQVAKAAAKRFGVSTREVLQAMPDARSLMIEAAESRERAKETARRLTGMNAGVLARVENAYRDHSTVPGFDTAARSVAFEHPELGIDPDADDASSAVWELIREGKQSVPAIDSQEVAEAAAEMALNAKRSARQSRGDGGTLTDTFDAAFSDALDDWGWTDAVESQLDEELELVPF